MRVDYWMKIAIPSYNRSQLIITHKLFRDNDVYVFVPESQYKDYSYLDNIKNVHLVIVPDDRDGSISKKRNYILEYFDWEDIVMLDDDIVGIMELWSNGQIVKEPISEADMLLLFNDTLSALRKFWFHLWWIAWTTNAMFLHRRISTVAFISSELFIISKWSDLRFDELFSAKEDTDYCVQNIMKYWWVIKKYRIMVKKKKYIWKGWVSQQRQEWDIEEQGAKRLMKKWWGILLRKNNGNIILNRKHFRWK